jgi:hypothetical protein
MANVCDITLCNNNVHRRLTLHVHILQAEMTAMQANRRYKTNSFVPNNLIHCMAL